MNLYDAEGYRLACPRCGRLNGWTWVRIGDDCYQCTCGAFADPEAVKASEAIRLGKRRPVTEPSWTETATQS